MRIGRSGLTGKNRPGRSCFAAFRGRSARVSGSWAVASVEGSGAVLSRCVVLSRAALCSAGGTVSGVPVAWLALMPPRSALRGVFAPSGRQ